MNAPLPTRHIANCMRSDDETFLRKYVTRRQPIEVIANGVDLSYFNPDVSFGAKEPQPTMVFCGAMDYNPNVDGLRWYFR